MPSDITLVLIVSIFTTLLLVGLTIYLFSVFYSSKSKLQEKNSRLESEVSKSQIEIREEFMKHIGKELHDNVGQLLSTAKLQLSMSPHRKDIGDSIDIIGESLSEIRNISKRIDPDAVKNMGFIDSCQREIDRLDKIDGMSAKIYTSGDEWLIPPKDEIILFRIIQESLNNLIKHAKATEVLLRFQFGSKELIAILTDDGVGFDTVYAQKTGSGLYNMDQRAQMIGAQFDIKSEINQGTTTTILYPK